MRIRSGLFVAGLAFIVAGCAQLLGPREGSLHDLRLELQVSDAVLVRGDTTDVVLTIRNPGAGEVRITGRAACPPWGVQVLDDAGQELSDPHLNLPCILLPGAWTIASRGSLVHTFRWTGEISRQGQRERLPPRTYQLVGILETMGEQIRSAPIRVELIDG